MYGSMDSMKPSEDAAKVIIIATYAAEIVLSYFNKQVDVELKDKEAFNFLTTADRKANDYIDAALKKAFPGDKILLEENAEQPKDYHGRVWMADPLDGTKEFLAGGTLFTVMIGLCIDGVPAIGCVVAPTTGTVYWAEKGKGAFMITRDGKMTKLEANKVSELKDARIVVSVGHGEVRPAEAFLHDLPLKAHIRSSSFGLRAAKVAKQEAEFFVSTNMRASKWDTCAPQIILEEAGGKMTDIYGKPLNYLQKPVRWEHSFVASNGAMHAKAIEAIQGIDKLLK